MELEGKVAVEMELKTYLNDFKVSALEAAEDGRHCSGLLEFFI
jgi:hypothetical protein